MLLEDTLKAHPDLTNGNHIIELKDVNGIYNFTDPRKSKYSSFDSYFLQLLYYMVMADKEKGHILIKHSNSKIILDKLKAKKIQVAEEDRNPLRAFKLVIPLDDPVREMIKDNLRFKSKMFIKATKEKNVKLLPKTLDATKCIICPYKAMCHDAENADILLDESVRDMLREDYIVRKVRRVYKNLGELI